MGAPRRRPQGKFADQESVVPDGLGQLPVRRRVDDIDAAAEDGDRDALSGQRAAMCGRVDARGESADDREPALGQSAGELEGRVGSRASRIAAADGGQLRLAERLEVAGRIERDGAIGERREQLRILRIGERHQVMTGALEPSKLRRARRRRVPQILPSRGGHRRMLAPSVVGADEGGGGAGVDERGAQHRGVEPRRAGERQPSENPRRKAACRPFCGRGEPSVRRETYLIAEICEARASRAELAIQESRRGRRRG